MQNYKELMVWEKSMDLVEEVYRIVSLLPKQEQFALSDQLRRAVVSVPSNIAEGYGRYAVRDYNRFLSIARSSKNEVETQLYICVRLKYISENDIEKAFALCDEIGRMLNSLINKLNPNP